MNIILDNLSFRYRKKDTPALSGVSACIGSGIYLLAGENGAGKTTLLHIIAGLMFPESGRCMIDGKPAYSDVPSERRRVFLLEENALLTLGTIREFAAVHSVFYPGFSIERFEENLRSFGLSGDERLRHLSLGNRKKSQLAYVLALGVDLLLLDEPTNGLDIEGRDVLRKLVIEAADSGMSIIIATHSMSEIETMVDGALILKGSRLMFAGTEDELLGKVWFTDSVTDEDIVLYKESKLGRTSAICRVGDSNVSARVNWRMLYNALHSDRSEELFEMLK